MGIALGLALLLIAANAMAQVLVFDCASLDQFRRDGAPIYPAENAWYKKNCVETIPRPTPTPTPNPPVDTCAHLPLEIVVSGFKPFSTQCKQVGAAGVAIPELMAQGILEAVDVFGIVDAEMRICFRQQGRLKFLDSTTMPRAETDLPAEYVDGMTCGRIDRIGTLLLMQTGETQAVAVAGPVALANCPLRTSENLSLRGGPSAMYARKAIIPRGTRLLATAGNSGWFLVEYEERLGWISGEYAEASPACDAIGSSDGVFLPVATEPTEDAIEEPAATAGREADATPSASDPPLDCRVTTGDIINLRERPGLEYEILTEIPNQTSLVAAERAGDWFAVEHEGRMGWVNIGFVFRNGYCG